MRTLAWVDEVEGGLSLSFSGYAHKLSICSRIDFCNEESWIFHQLMQYDVHQCSFLGADQDGVSIDRSAFKIFIWSGFVSVDSSEIVTIHSLTSPSSWCPYRPILPVPIAPEISVIIFDCVELSVFRTSLGTKTHVEVMVLQSGDLKQPCNHFRPLHGMFLQWIPLRFWIMPRTLLWIPNARNRKTFCICMNNVHNEPPLDDRTLPTVTPVAFHRMHRTSKMSARILQDVPEYYMKQYLWQVPVISSR